MSHDSAPTHSPTPDPYSALPRRIGMLGGLGVMLGIIIGSGIFRTPAAIAGSVDSTWLILGVWVLGGVISLLGALTYAELATMFPQSGGVYVFIREAYGRSTAFVFGWTYMLISKPAAAAGIAVIVGETLNRLLGTNWDTRIVTSAILIGFTLINVVGVRLGAGVAVFLTALKLATLAGIVVLGLSLAAGPGTPVEIKPFKEVPWYIALGVVMALVLWTYDGWSDVGAIAGEVKEPQRTLPRIYLVGTALITAVYVAVNWTYLHVISLAEMRSLPTVAPEVLLRVLGPIGATAAAVAVIVSAVGSTHGSVMTGARVTFQQARDGLLFRPLGAVHPRFQTPYVALWVQLALSLIAAWWLGSFEALANSFVFTMWIFYGLAGAAIFILRFRRPEHARPFRCPGYPLVPAVFVLSAAGMTALSLVGDWKQNLIWVGVLLAGYPVAWAWQRFAK